MAQPVAVLHNDLNDWNVLVARDAVGAPHLTGIIDFGDAKTPRPYDNFLNAAFADITDWWAENYPVVYGDAFVPVEAIYAHTGMTLSPAGKQAMEVWMEKNRRDKREAHEYNPTDFGLSEEQLKRDFADYRKKYVEAA